MAIRRSMCGLMKTAKRAVPDIMGPPHCRHYEQHKHPHVQSRDRFHNRHGHGCHVPVALSGTHWGFLKFSSQVTLPAEDCTKRFSREENNSSAEDCTKRVSGEENDSSANSSSLSHEETRKLLKLMKLEDFRKVLTSSGNHCMSVEEVSNLCKQVGAATTDAEAEEIIKNLDEAGVVLIFRKKVFLQPDEVANLLAKSMPFHLASENDPRLDELAQLQREKEEIDRIARRQVKNMLWGALGAFTLQSAVFFRLTFWDLSWDVMEPITFFVTSSSLLAGFFFFVLTHRDPSYRDLMDTLVRNKQQKLMQKKQFNEERLKELQMQCCIPSYASQKTFSKDH